MTDMQSFFSKMFDHMGEHAPQMRTFVIDYHERDGADRYDELTALVPQGMDDRQLLYTLVRPMMQRGCVIDAVHEVLNGYSYKEIDVMFGKRPLEAAEHFRPLFINRNAIPDVLAKNKGKIDAIRRQCAEDNLS